MTQSWNYGPDGGFLTAFQNVPNPSIVSYTNVVAPDEHLLLQARERSDGSGAASIKGDYLTARLGAGAFSLDTSGETWTMTFHARESVDLTGASDDTIALGSGFGTVALSGFDVARDFLSFDDTLVSSFDDLLGHTSSAANGLDLKFRFGVDTLTLLGALTASESAADYVTAHRATFGG
jgi:hypothetical protein